MEAYIFKNTHTEIYYKDLPNAASCLVPLCPPGPPPPQCPCPLLCPFSHINLFFRTALSVPSTHLLNISMAPSGLQDEVLAFLSWPGELSHQPLQPHLFSRAVTPPWLLPYFMAQEHRMIVFPTSCSPTVAHALPAFWNPFTFQMHLVHVANSGASFKTPLSHHLFQNCPWHNLPWISCFSCYSKNIPYFPLFLLSDYIRIISCVSTSLLDYKLLNLFNFVLLDSKMLVVTKYMFVEWTNPGFCRRVSSLPVIKLPWWFRSWPCGVFLNSCWSPLSAASLGPWASHLDWPLVCEAYCLVSAFPLLLIPGLDLHVLPFQ